MKFKDLKAMSMEELALKEADFKQELFNLAIQKSIGSLENPRRKKIVKRHIAQIKTILSERK